MWFSYFAIISPGKMCGPSYEQNWIPFTKECFVPSLVKIGPVVLEKKIYNVVNVILLFCYYFSFEKGVALHLNTRFPFTPCATFDWNKPSGSGGEDEHVKSLQKDRQWTTGDQKAYLSFQLRWAKKWQSDVKIEVK